MLGLQRGPVSGRPAAKKLVIKNRRVDSPGKKAEVERYFDATWKEVDAAVQAVLAGERVPMPLDRVYRGVEDLCRNKMDKDVYDRLRKACERHLVNVVLPAIKAEDGNGDIAVLAVVLSEWKIYNEKSVCGLSREMGADLVLMESVEVDKVDIQLPGSHVSADTERLHANQRHDDIPVPEDDLQLLQRQATIRASYRAHRRRRHVRSSTLR